ncbi:hypothetical protein ACYSNW_03700 [Enterococcus sp. LJL99]
MNYHLFSILFQEALACDSLENFYSKHATQEWLKDYENIPILTTIFNLSKMSVSDLYKSIGMSQTKFAISYDIPLAVVREWDSGQAIVPNYIIMLVAYTLID